jgi:hypothetical protein
VSFANYLQSVLADKGCKAQNQFVAGGFFEKCIAKKKAILYNSLNGEV